MTALTTVRSLTTLPVVTLGGDAVAHVRDTVFDTSARRYRELLPPPPGPGQPRPDRPGRLTRPQRGAGNCATSPHAPARTVHPDRPTPQTDVPAGGRSRRCLACTRERTLPLSPAFPLHNWLAALAAVIASLAAMAVMATLGIWAAGAADLPDGAFAPVLAAVLVLAVGGTVRLSGDAGGLAGTEGGLTVIPLSVTLTGALLLGWCFLRPLHRRTVAGAPGLAAWAARIAVVWILAVLGLALAARRTFEVSLGRICSATWASCSG